MAELSSPTQQQQQEMESCWPQDQRQTALLEPQCERAQTSQDSQQQDQDMPAFLQTLLESLDTCRRLNHMRLGQLQLQQSVVEQKHQDLISQKRQHQAMMEQDEKDTAQIEATSADSCSSSGASNDLLEEHAELLEQVALRAESEDHMQRRAAEEHQCRVQDTLSTGHSAAKEEAQCRGKQCQRAALSQAAPVPARSLAARSRPQRREEQLRPRAGSTMRCTEEQPCSCARSSMQHPADSSVVEPRVPQELAAGRELAVWLQMELSQWQQKQQVTLEQSLQHMHIAAHAKQELQKSQEQLQALEEQLRAQKERNWALQHSLAQEKELAATLSWELQSLQQLSGHKQTGPDLQQKADFSRKNTAELLQQVEEVASLKAELAKAQRKIGCHRPLLFDYEEERQQLHWEQQRAQEQNQQARSFQEKLQQLSSQVQCWQQLHQDARRTLAAQEMELALCKAKLAFKEEIIKAMEQARTRNRQNHSPRPGGAQPESQALLKDRSWLTGRAEVERPGQEWVNCRAKTNTGGGGGQPKEKRHKVQQQVKQAAGLTGENQHLHDTLGSLQVESIYLRARTRVQYHNHEQMKGSNLTARALQNSAGPSLPGTHLQDEKLYKTTEGLKTDNL